MLHEIDIFKLQSPEEIEEIFFELNTNLLKNNSNFFHFKDDVLSKYLKEPHHCLRSRFKKFLKSWENFNNHKQLLYHFFHCNTLEYPIIFNNSDRIAIDQIEINFQDLLEEINVLRLNKRNISYAYYQILYKTVKQIILKDIISIEQFLFLNLDIDGNLIELEYKDIFLNKTLIKTYKLNKFLFKYQKKYPEFFCNIKTTLIVSKNWQDIFLSSTFKQWTSCMNLIHTYKDKRIKYSNENHIKSGGLIAYLVLDLGDRKNDR